MDRLCRECGRIFRQEPRQQRPWEFCLKCKPAKKETDSRLVNGMNPFERVRKVKSKGYGNQAKKLDNSKAHGYGNDPKRDSDQLKFSWLIEHLGSINGRIATLCGDASELPNDIDLMKRTLRINDDQYIGFNYDAQIIAGNRKLYPNAWWFDDDMCSDFGMDKMIKLGTEVVYYDATAGIIGSSPGSKTVRKNMSRILKTAEMKNTRIVMLNFWLEGRGRGNSDLNDTIDLLSSIDGIDEWDLLPNYYDYVSPKRGGPKYRTVVLERRY